MSKCGSVGVRMSPRQGDVLFGDHLVQVHKLPVLLSTQLSYQTTPRPVVRLALGVLAISHRDCLAALERSLWVCLPHPAAEHWRPS